MSSVCQGRNEFWTSHSTTFRQPALLIPDVGEVKNKRLVHHAFEAFVAALVDDLPNGIEV
jgi:hypothetical protein